MTPPLPDTVHLVQAPGLVYYGYVGFAWLCAFMALLCLLPYLFLAYQRLTPGKARKPEERMSTDALRTVSPALLGVMALSVYGFWWTTGRVDAVETLPGGTVVLRGMLGQELARLERDTPREVSASLYKASGYTSVAEKVYVTVGDRTFGTFALDREDAAELRRLVAGEAQKR